jgi:SAM-dependent methyltransferase
VTEGVTAVTILKTDLFEEANGRAEVLWRLSDSARLIGMDVSQNMVLRAKKRNHAANAVFLAADVRQIGLASGSVDVIFSNSTLDHFASAEEFKDSLEELKRVLRPGGTIIITLDNIHNPLYHILKWLGSRGWAPFRMGYTTSLSGLVTELERLGIEVTATAYQIHNPRLISTALFLGARRTLGRFADGPVRFLLRSFMLLDRLPTRAYTACFIAARGRSGHASKSPE